MAKTPIQGGHFARTGVAISAKCAVGWVAGVLVNTTTGHVVDGHLRVELAISRNEPTVPVTYVELGEEEERVVLASLDPIGALARPDEDLRRLLADLGASANRGFTDPNDVPAVPATESIRRARGSAAAVPARS